MTSNYRGRFPLAPFKELKEKIQKDIKKQRLLREKTDSLRRKQKRKKLKTQKNKN